MSQETSAPKAPKPQSPKWYVLYTASRAEKAVERRLALMGAEVFLPLYVEKRKWSDRIKTVEVPLYRSYIFIHCTRAQLSKYAATEGVACPVYYCGDPAVVKDREIEEIRKFLLLLDSSRIISEGDMVQILGGPFERRTGRVTRIDNRFVYLTLESIGNLTVCAELRIEKDFVAGTSSPE